jgi:6-pyruvoyltetrahydropterin/6-carboxytetrahydropterin synthase
LKAAEKAPCEIRSPDMETSLKDKQRPWGSSESSFTTPKTPKEAKEPKHKEHFGIHLRKEYLKFSAAHFLIFPDGSSERLHGHNYQVEATIEGHLHQSGIVYDFLAIKPLLKQICDELDEHVILPGRHPELSFDKQEGHIYVTYRHKHYMFPEQEVLVLPIDNSSAERFAGYILERLEQEIKKIFPMAHISNIKVIVHESPGQYGYYWKSFSEDDAVDTA